MLPLSTDLTFCFTQEDHYLLLSNLQLLVLALHISPHCLNLGKRKVSMHDNNMAGNFDHKVERNCSLGMVHHLYQNSVQGTKL